jgi:putative FmdB family regulatory protein
MPIYEYRCRGCRRKVSLFFRSISSAEGGKCPECGSEDLERLFSRVLVRRGGSRGDDTSPGDDGVGFGDEMGPYDDFGFGNDPFGDDEPDPREMARWAREMSRQTGEPLDEDLEQALTDIERGADPDEVMDRLEDSPPPPLPDDKIE